jgi:hypothetical protein
MSGEGIASTRRNRMSIDLLYDDLNAACLYLTDLTAPPSLSTANPAFYILPNMPVAGASATDPATADQLFFYLDQPLPFEGTLTGTGAGATAAQSASQMVMSGSAPAATDNTFTVDCGNPTYAALVQPGCNAIIKDSFSLYSIQAAPTVVGTKVTFVAGINPLVAVSGVGPSGAPSKVQHNLQSGVLFYLPAQMVQYQVVMKQFDPQSPTGIPCLVREQGTYSSAGFVPNPALETVVAENIDGFKVYLSANSGVGWAGLGATYTGFANGWTGGIQTALNTQLATAGRPNFTTTAGDANWTRDIPTLVRLDITTRTATERAEYSATPTLTRAYKDFTQSLVIVPRHFGLTMN